VSRALLSVVTALGDDELVVGHRHSEWTGFAPHIEEDVAFSSIAQDEIGHAGAYYALAARLTEGDADRLALGRDKDDYRHAVVCERPNRDWAFTLARHWLYDHADALRLEMLEQTTHPELAAVVTKIRREERYHLLHADIWMQRIAHGPVEGRRNLMDAVGRAFEDALGLFEPFENESEAVAEGILPAGSDELRKRFLEQTSAELDRLGFPTHMIGTADAEFVASSSGDLIVEHEAGDAVQHHGGQGGRNGRHSDEWSTLWDDMTRTYRENPGARW
jgi:ring-1,2-phenylacetyl-CoA epoxidase subunit PaaC